MKQKRKVKSLLPQKSFVNGKILTILLVVLSLLLCIGGVSLLTHSVKAQGNDGPNFHNLFVNYQYSGGIVIFTGKKTFQEGELYTVSNEEIQNYNPSVGNYDPYPEQIAGKMYDHDENRSVTFIPRHDDNGDGIDDNLQYLKLFLNWGDSLKLNYFSDETWGYVPFEGGFEYETGNYNIPYYDIDITGSKIVGNSFEGGVPVGGSYFQLTESKLKVRLEKPGNNHTITVSYIPQHDINGNDIPDELEYTVEYTYSKPGLGNIADSGTGYCKKKGDVINISVPKIEGYKPDKDGDVGNCEGVIGQIINVTYYPEKDQNNDGIWDGEQELWEVTEFDYTGLDNKVEVLYGMRFVDPLNLMRVVNIIYVSGSSLYITPKPVIVYSSYNDVNDDVYSHILGGLHNEVFSNNITLIAGSNNIVHAGNDNASILGGNGNKVMLGNGAPAILVGGESNVMETGHNGNVLIGGKNNKIEDGHSNVFILGGENNTILGKDDLGLHTPSENVIVGGNNVKIVGINNIFVYSNSDSEFSPLTTDNDGNGNAFYLNVGSGVGINTGGIEGLSVGGAVSIGEIDININKCTGDNLGVIGSYKGCIVGCTQAGINTGKWELLDQGSGCVQKCKNKCLYNNDIEVVDVPESSAQCTEGVVNTGHAHLCIDDLGSYKNVIFESSLIDSEEKCPVGQNVCVYQCDEGYHLTGDRTTGKIGCYSDCKLPWDSTTSIRHNETVVGYNIEDVSCSNDIYVFPLETEIINTGQPGPTYQKGNIKRGTITYKNRAKYGTSYESCGNYDHKKTLICNNGVLELMNNKGKPISGSSVLAQEYKYDSCNLYNYRCDTSKYTLTSGQIEAEKNDGPMNNGSREVADRGILTGRRGLYEACIDFDANPTNPTNNGETCSKKTYHYYFSGCKDGYVLGDDGICRKDCSLIDKDGNLIGYHNNVVVTGYQVASTQCPDECTGSKLVCDDGLWHIGGKTGAVADGTWYNYCNGGKKTCGSEFNVNQSEHDTGVSTSFYSNCVNYSVSSNICTTGATVYKLTGCIENYHANETMKWCVSNTGYSQCYEGFKPDNSDYVIVNVPITWNGTWDSGNWTDPESCNWKCNTGYTQITGDDGVARCASSGCGVSPYTCSDTSVTPTNVGENQWNCLDKICCSNGYTEIGGECVKNVDGVCGSGHYNCSPGSMKNDRNEGLSGGVAYSWDCLGVGSGTTSDLGCVECANGYLQDGKTCKLIKNGLCSQTKYFCEDGSPINTGEDASKYYWDCAGENGGDNDEGCYQCKPDYQDNGDRECELCATNYEFEIMNVSGCYVMFKVTYYDPLQNGNPRPLTGSDFNSKFLLRYSKDGVNYRSLSHVEQTSGNMNKVKLFNNAESGTIYLKLQSKSGSCFGFVRSREVLSQSCPYESSCPNGGKTFYDGTCFNWEYNALYSSTGRKIANISSWGLASDGTAPSQYCDSLPSLSGCSITDKDPQKIYSGNLHVVCPGNYGGNYWNLLKSSNVIWGTGNLERIGAMGGAVLYIPGYDNSRTRIVLKNIVGQYSSFYFYIDKNDSRYSCYAGYLYEYSY